VQDATAAAKKWVGLTYKEPVGQAVTAARRCQHMILVFQLGPDQGTLLQDPKQRETHHQPGADSLVTSVHRRVTPHVHQNDAFPNTLFSSRVQ
jgi:hypothetical protein